MTNAFIDLRSDTVTRPTPGMLRAMMEADVGDDVLGEDPTVNRLQAHVAELLGKETALFVPSGTMSNQIAIKVHTQPGDQLLCDLNCHIYVYEQGGPAALSGVTCWTIEGVNGLLTLEQLSDKVQPDNEHLVRTRLVCLENTHNRGGGSIYSLAQLEKIGAWAKQNNLRMHLDGARLWNAIVATGVPAKQWAAPFDTISVCFSKGLGAPVGSALAGSRELIGRAHRVRKLFGGGMRQVGNLAAAALYALDHQLDRLADDHRHARWLAEAIATVPGLKINHERVDTNMLWLKVDPVWASGEQVVDVLREQGILILATGRNEVRACTHLDVSADQAQRAASVFRRLPAVLSGSTFTK